MPSVARVPSIDLQALPEGNRELYVLKDERAGSEVSLAPGRGALVTSFRVRGRELLYLDRSTLADPSKSVRGGIPVLFPSPGKLEGDTLRLDGRSFPLNQHGFARTLPWTVVATRDAPASVTLTLESSAATLARYPFEFVATFAFTLEHAALRIEQRIENRSGRPMPFALGFHPYFVVADKARARVDTGATRAFDNRLRAEVPFRGFDLTEPEVDLHLVDHGGSASALHLADGARLDLRCSAEYWRWVVWTLAGKDFVCVEPWTAAGNALNTGERVLTLPPGRSHDAFMEIAFTAPA